MSGAWRTQPSVGLPSSFVLPACLAGSPFCADGCCAPISSLELQSVNFVRRGLNCFRSIDRIVLVIDRQSLLAEYPEG